MRPNTIADDQAARLDSPWAQPCQWKSNLSLLAQDFFCVVCDFAQGSMCVFGKNIQTRLSTFKMDPAALKELMGKIEKIV